MGERCSQANEATRQQITTATRGKVSRDANEGVNVGWQPVKKTSGHVTYF